ncbi:MAG: DinB family protein [Acidobacteriaceae bacterium]|nr:DinB family protein [Acidobacteriaceae bacterium]
MKTALKYFLCITALASAAGAQQITPAERTQGLQYLNESTEGLEAAVTGLSPAQWTYKPSANQWSIAEIVEHLAITEAVIEDIFKKMPNAPAAPANRDVKQVDAMILSRVPDRSTKVQAPPPLIPTGKKSGPDSLKAFLATRQETVIFLNSSPDLRGHVVDHPVLGPLDGYEWVLTLAAHSQRHTKQILEVKADPHFPAD